MGSSISSHCNSGRLSSVTQASCQFVLNGISGKTFDEIKYRVHVNASGDENTTYNVKLENLTKTITVFEDTNIKLTQHKKTHGDLPILTYEKNGIISQNWVGDTLEVSIIKQSGSTPELLQISTITQTHYTD